MSDEILLGVKDGIATITLNRPEKLNAFTPGMLETWCAAYRECQARSDVLVIVLTGAGRGFCSGGDTSTMGDRADNSPLETKNRIWNMIQSPAKTLQDVDKPVIAAINGVATGGGLDVALMCDIRVAARGARMGETYSRIGLIPGGGGAFYLPRILGTAKALELLWTGDLIDAEEALRIGLVSYVYPADEFMDRTYAFARRIADAPPLSVRFIKRTVYQAMETDLRTSLDTISSHLTVVRASEDHIEGIAALREKRKPVFKGR